MSSYIYKSDLKAEYFYNGIGQRVLKKFHNKHGVIWNYQFTYNAQGQMIHYAAFSDGNHSSQRWEDDIVWLNNKPVAVSRSYHDDNAQNTHDLLYILSDHLNTPRKLADATGMVLWSWNSDAFGTTAPDQDVGGDGIKTVFHLRFPGQYFDLETKQHYNYFRDYEPDTGMYLESDPIGLEGGINTFGYVDQNPLYGIDYFGLREQNNNQLDNNTNFGWPLCNFFGRPCIPPPDSIIEDFFKELCECIINCTIQLLTDVELSLKGVVEDVIFRKGAGSAVTIAEVITCSNDCEE